MPVAAESDADSNAGRAALYADADLGPLLHSEPFRAVRAKCPEPAEPEQ